MGLRAMSNHQERESPYLNEESVDHGTNTMIETAEKLSGIKDKVIVLTGVVKHENSLTPMQI